MRTKIRTTTVAVTTKIGVTTLQLKEMLEAKFGCKIPADARFVVDFDWNRGHYYSAEYDCDMPFRLVWSEETTTTVTLEDNDE